MIGPVGTIFLALRSEFAQMKADDGRRFAI
jgi:hypothetical protein